MQEHDSFWVTHLRVCLPQLSMDTSCSPLFKSKLCQKHTDEIARVVSFLSLEACLVCRTDSAAASSWWPSAPQQYVRGARISVGLGVLFFTSIPSTGEALLFDNSEVHLCGRDWVMLLSLNLECTVCEEAGKQGPVCLLIPHELSRPYPWVWTGQ